MVKTWVWDGAVMKYDLRLKRSLNWAGAVPETPRAQGRKGGGQCRRTDPEKWDGFCSGTWGVGGGWTGQSHSDRAGLGSGAELGRGPEERRGRRRAAWRLLPSSPYSFVIGSDGYVYEGRGWHWVGAHTLGHNSRGFGVAFVGNYTAELPTEAALRTVQDVLPGCAVRAGFLRPDYTLLGHRQLVRTDCPGDALFNLLRTWPRFAAVSTRRRTTSACGRSLRTSSERSSDPCLPAKPRQAPDSLL